MRHDRSPARRIATIWCIVFCSVACTNQAPSPEAQHKFLVSPAQKHIIDTIVMDTIRELAKHPKRAHPKLIDKLLLAHDATVEEALLPEQWAVYQARQRDVIRSHILEQARTLNRHSAGPTSRQGAGYASPGTAPIDI